MDRDKRWDRVEAAYKAVRFSDAIKAKTPEEAVQNSYSNSKTDEFILPTVINGINGKIEDGDSLFFINFRADRMREMLHVFYDEEFAAFQRNGKPDVELLTMTLYDKSVPVPALFPPECLDNILGEVISNLGLKQLRIAETEKYAHVTYFFNGGREEPFNLEERILVNSPRDVPTYDLKPQMSAEEVTDKFEKRFLAGDISFAVMNLANPDMVGHTGVETAATAACVKVDKMVGRVMDVAKRTDAVLFVTADHGNCEQMWDDETNQPHTAHTINPVRFIMYNGGNNCFKASGGKLADIAPTILKIMNIKVPYEMTGNVLI
jgi:2,3-bisphosphoglycerate-independent phosphoglycerate mutase